MQQGGAAQAEFAAHRQIGVRLDLLGQQFPQQLLLGEALGADHDRLGRLQEP